MFHRSFRAGVALNTVSHRGIVTEDLDRQIKHYTGLWQDGVLETIKVFWILRAVVDDAISIPVGEAGSRSTKRKAEGCAPAPNTGLIMIFPKHESKTPFKPRSGGSMDLCSNSNFEVIVFSEKVFSEKVDSKSKWLYEKNPLVFRDLSLKETFDVRIANGGDALCDSFKVSFEALKCNRACIRYMLDSHRWTLEACK